MKRVANLYLSKPRYMTLLMTVIVVFLLITGCVPYKSVYRLPLGEKNLRKLYVNIRKGETWNLETGTLISFDDMLDTLTDRTIVYAGERHDNTSHHKLQLDIIKALYRKNPNLIIGMEMFQTSSQEVLDRWIKGELTEVAFLDEVEWYYKWKIPYNYYKDILDFAKENGITVIAMNIPKDVLIRVMSKGLDHLTEEEQGMLPTITPLTKEYKDYMKNNYRGHPGAHTPSFEDFVTTQSLWDDAMAESILLAIDRKTFANPQMVVITGFGHIIYDLGIPDRVYRRSNLSYAIVLPIGLEEKESVEVAQSVGTFVVGTDTPPPLPLVPQFGVTFTMTDKEDGKRLLIKTVKMGSVAEKAGIKSDDIIISFDGVDIKTPHTLTRLLRGGIWYKAVKITVKRKGKMVTVKAIFPPEPTTNDIEKHK